MKLTYYNDLRGGDLKNAVSDKLADYSSECWLTHSFFGMDSEKIGYYLTLAEGDMLKAREIFTNTGPTFSDRWLEYYTASETAWPRLLEAQDICIDPESYATFDRYPKFVQDRTAARTIELTQAIRDLRPDANLIGWRIPGPIDGLIWRAEAKTLDDVSVDEWAENWRAVEDGVDYVAIPAYIAPSEYPAWSEDRWQANTEAKTQFLIDVAKAAGFKTRAYTAAKKDHLPRVPNDVYAAHLHWLRDRVDSVCVMVSRHEEGDDQEIVLRDLDTTIAVLGAV